MSMNGKKKTKLCIKPLVSFFMICHHRSYVSFKMHYIFAITRGTKPGLLRYEELQSYATNLYATLDKLSQSRQPILSAQPPCAQRF